MIRPQIAVAVLAVQTLLGSVTVLVPELHAEPAAVESAQPTSNGLAKDEVTAPLESRSAAKNQRTAIEPTKTARQPPAGLWGQTLQDGNDPGIRKATNGAYNYKHIAFSLVIVVFVMIGLITLVRRHSGSPREPGR